MLRWCLFFGEKAKVDLKQQLLAIQAASVPPRLATSSLPIDSIRGADADRAKCKKSIEDRLVSLVELGLKPVEEFMPSAIPDDPDSDLVGEAQASMMGLSMRFSCGTPIQIFGAPRLLSTAHSSTRSEWFSSMLDKRLVQASNLR